MIATSLLTLTAVISSVEGGIATIDKGFTDGLRPGDTGQVYYTLAVGPERRPARIDVGPLEVVAVEDFAATLEVPAALAVRAGFPVEFRIAKDRFSPVVQLLDLARSRLEEGRRDEALHYLEALERIHELEPGTPMLAERIRGLRAAIELKWPRQAEPRRMTLVPGGTYSVGAELAEARFYNQYPRFQTVLETFRIDPTPVTRTEFLELGPDVSFPAGEAGGFATGVSFQDAEQHCRRRGRRVPTELEWETAVRTRGLANDFPLYEWTSSWYQPYPGNTFPEEQYGEEYRVLRGSPHPGETDPRLRSYMKPELRRPDVGFRCARDVTSDEI